MSEKISLYEIILLSKLTKANCTKDKILLIEIKEILMTRGQTYEEEEELKDRVHYFTNLARRKKEDLKDGVLRHSCKMSQIWQIYLCIVLWIILCNFQKNAFFGKVKWKQIDLFVPIFCPRGCQQGTSKGGCRDLEWYLHCPGMVAPFKVLIRVIWGPTLRSYLLITTQNMRLEFFYKKSLLIYFLIKFEIKFLYDISQLCSYVCWEK